MNHARSFSSSWTFSGSEVHPKSEPEPVLHEDDEKKAYLLTWGLGSLWRRRRPWVTGPTWRVEMVVDSAWGVEIAVDSDSDGDVVPSSSVRELDSEPDSGGSFV